VAKGVKNNLTGMVYLIGAGPGRPDLITVRGRECLKRADIVVYDYLVNESLLSFNVKKQAECIYVGKKAGRHTLDQKEINALLVEKARAGLEVARLKGGDPFVFGRGGEEAMELSRAGIAFEIIPGMTSAIAVPAYAGIALTHREYASTVCFITGHEDPTKETSRINWDALGKSQGTLVFLMGIGNLEKIARELIERGRPSHLPVAVIGNGTLPVQRTIIGTLDTICRKVKEKAFVPPGIIVVGDVVNLRSSLNWFETRGLFGKRIVVTRPEDQAGGLIGTLSELGAETVPFATIKIAPPSSWRELDRAIESLSAYYWVIFTSVNGVAYFFERLRAGKKDARYFGAIKIGAIGAKTAAALAKRGLTPDLVPENYWSEGIVQALEAYPLEGKRVLLPRPVTARDYLPARLTSMGARVDVIEAYRTVRPDIEQDQIETLFKDRKVDMITFTSPSTIENFLAMLQGTQSLLEISKIDIACIGPITAQKATERGLRVSVVPEKYTVEGLAAAIAAYYMGA
jgi:uroporphyrinogen III methyltransferase/synthase